MYIMDSNCTCCMCDVWRGILYVYYGFLWYVWCLTRDFLCILRIVMVSVISDTVYYVYKLRIVMVSVITDKGFYMYIMESLYCMCDVLTGDFLCLFRIVMVSCRFQLSFLNCLCYTIIFLQFNALTSVFICCDLMPAFRVTVYVLWYEIFVALSSDVTGDNFSTVPYSQ